MATYYHVAPGTYQDGECLLSFNEQEARGWEPVWKWDEEMVDCDVVCLYRTIGEAQEHIEVFQPSGRILLVTIPDDDDMLSMTQVQEGYPAVYREIPARYIKAI